MDNQQQIDCLNELLKGEHMALSIYHRTKNLQGDEQVHSMLDSFAQDHQRHADTLADRIKQLGGDPKTSLGFPGTMAHISSSINALRGPSHVLKQLYDGEDKGVHAYEDRVDELDEESQTIVRQIMGEDHDHLKVFKERMEAEEKEKEE